MANETRTFRLPKEIDLQDVVSNIDTYLRVEKAMETQSSPTADGFVLQASQKKDGWKTISGTRLAITVQFMQVGEEALNVTIGEGNWSDKIGASALGWFVAWPLAVTAGVGMYKQKKLPGLIFDKIERFILSGGRQPYLIGSDKVKEGTVVCSSCKTVNAADSAFCKKCGSPLRGKCPNCGAEIDSDSAFCPKCGKPITTTNTCPGCGASVESDSAFCPKCGQKLG